MYLAGKETLETSDRRYKDLVETLPPPPLTKLLEHVGRIVSTPTLRASTLAAFGHSSAYDTDTVVVVKREGFSSLATRDVHSLYEGYLKRCIVRTLEHHYIMVLPDVLLPLLRATLTSEQLYPKAYWGGPTPDVLVERLSSNPTMLPRDAAADCTAVQVH